MKKILLILSVVLFTSQSAFAQYQKSGQWLEMEQDSSQDNKQNTMDMGSLADIDSETNSNSSVQTNSNNAVVNTVEKPVLRLESTAPGIDDYMVNKSLSSAIAGYTFTAAFLGMNIFNWSVWGSFKLTTYSALGVSFVNMIVAPIIYRVGKKGQLLHYSPGQSVINGFGWFFYALSVGCFSVNLSFPFNFNGSYTFWGFNSIVGIFSMASSFLSIALLSTNALLTFTKTRRAIRKSAEEELYSAKRRFAVLPTANTFVGTNKKVSGGTLGVAVVF